jgi:Vacuolar membrane-associated protein Iml1
LSRGDLHFFQKDLIGTWIYEGQRLHEPTRNIMANAREIRHGGSLARSGIITENTVITYRSRSARIFWLVQISREMWDYASPYGKIMDEYLCEIYFDKFISFVYELFKKWKEVEATHSLTVVFFSRTFLGSRLPGAPNAVDQRDVYGRRYEDHCRVVIENETKTDWNSMVVRIRKAFSKYPVEVGWNLSTGENTRRPSMASQGNVLEAINVTLNLLQNHYLDRDLHRTGNSIVVVSAGNGVFEVDKGLANITYQRMMDNGIGSDILSLGLPPLHIAPFFLYINEYQGVESEGVDSSETYFEVPHWMHLSFVDYKSDTNVPTETRVNEIDDIDDETNPSPLDIGPNGFLRHRFVDKLSTRARPKIANPLDHHPTAFSVAGNLAASPAHNKRTKGDQERQLISGRDFGDILEACRPRHTGTLPSPLKALLEMYSAGGCNRISQVSISENNDSLKEWGTLDISDDPKDNSFLISQRLTLAQDRPSPLFMSRSPPMVDELERLDSLGKASQGSSYNSQISSGRLGVSYDRPFLAHQTSPTLTGIQMQRAPSLEWETDEDSDTGVESASTVELDQTGSDDGDSVATSRFTSRLLKSMRAHDSNVLGVRSTKANQRQDVDRSRHVVERSLSTRTGPAPGSMQSPRFGPQPSTTLGALSVPLQNPGSQAMSLGGIGAALLQYGSSTGQSPGATNSSDAETSSSTMMKSISTGRLLGTSTPALGRIPELPHGFSPLLLPPGAIVRRDFPNIAGRALEARFIPPQRIANGAESGSAVPRNEVMFRHDSFFLNKSHHVTSQSSLTTLSLLKAETSPEKNTRSERSVSVSPPRFLADSTRKVDRFAAQNRTANRDPPSSRRRKKAFNPFRQRDEDEVLAQKSHNRRRWSHVFPLGEVEFKRHVRGSRDGIDTLNIARLAYVLTNNLFFLYNLGWSQLAKSLRTSDPASLY